MHRFFAGGVAAVCGLGFIVGAQALGAAAWHADSFPGGAALTAQPVQARSTEAGPVFQGVGVVTATQPAGSLTVSHEPIQGLMPAMEMMFSVKPPTLAKGVKPGDKITFGVEGKTSTIVNLKVVGHVK